MFPCSFLLTINSIFTSINEKINRIYEFILSFFPNKMSQSTNDDQLILYFTAPSIDSMVKRPFRFPSSSEFHYIQIIYSFLIDYDINNTKKTFI